MTFAHQEKLRALLDTPEQQGFIKVSEPTEWVNSLVIIEKVNGKIRLRIDPKALNKAIQREHFQLPSKEEILSELVGARFFTKMDAAASLHQIKLDECSSKLTTFNTPCCHYRYLRMPMGISSAPEVFHKKLRQLLEDLPGCRVFFVDLIVWGSTHS